MNQELMNNSANLVIIRGLPGSGKTYIANELIKQNLPKPIALLDPDKINFDSNEYLAFSEDLQKNGVDLKLHPYRFLRNKAYETIELNGTVIWTQAFTHLDLLDRTIKNLESHAGDKNSKLNIYVVEVDIDENTAKKRVQKREKEGELGVSDDNFRRFLKDYKSFKEYGYKTLVVDGRNDANNSLQKILSFVS